MMKTLRKKTVSVLVVDDDVNGSQALCDHLNFRGYQATSVHSGPAALDYLKTLKEDDLPEAILLDVLMPKMSGCEVLNLLRYDPRTKGIPVILLSVLSRDEVPEHVSCNCSGFDVFISKPFEMNVLVRELEGVLR